MTGAHQSPAEDAFRFALTGLSGTIVDLLGNLAPDLRFTVQFCPNCRRWDKWDEYLLCPVHAGIRLGAAETGPGACR